MRRVALACLAIAAVCVAGGPAEAGAKTKIKTRTFSSGPINRPIPDAVRIGPISSGAVAIEDFIRIRRRGRVKDVNVALRISHADNRWLDVDLFHTDFAILVGELPDATGVRRWRDAGDPKGADFGAGVPDCTGAMTVFDSQSPLSVVAGSSPYAGRFAPLSSLDVFKRVQLSGKWRLELIDIEPGDAGVLNCWELTIRYEPQRGKLQKAGDKKEKGIKT